jgi:hypothetical protein
MLTRLDTAQDWPYTSTLRSRFNSQLFNHIQVPIAGFPQACRRYRIVCGGCRNSPAREQAHRAAQHASGIA